ncbi:NPAT isoform X1 [Solea senegalensis]|uniref:NPAT isoform X1 n=2 Tax=Solea senegalensis TaxID=28829 RepID=A0AAV6Q199_SOLSE|nr:protein NPAT isoform X1 [Solea senegalensis]KAG7479684.1 NPAT isoform X1 [Solea senegalensis]
MLLPSDVARLVLGYLQEEGLSATSQTFIHESPNLKEYADHTTEDGTIPACVFSIFGKGLTNILNDYVAAKTKESHPEVPVMMTSLWKKLDLTLNQIKSLQNSPAISANQRTRTRMGLANMARQRVLTVASAGGVVCSSVSETISSISPTHTSFSTISHSTPVSYTTPHSRLALGSGTHQQISDDRILNIPKDSPVNIVVAEHRLNPGPMSPGRRKWDTPRKRSAAVGGSSSVGRSAAAVSSHTAEPQPEEQLVIQNACDKILGDRSLQEKLAENINKILANEPTPQTSKPPSATVEPDQSIDEILGLQGEIHMSDDAIHDILEQTESDPAFQALFDLFDCNKAKFPHGEPGDGDGDVGNSPEESEAAGSSTVGLLQNNNPDTTQRDSTASETTAATMKTRVGQDRKTRRSAAPTLLKKTFLPSSGRASRIEGSSARLLVSQGGHRAVPSAAVNSDRKEGTSLFNDSVSVIPMDIDEPLNTPPPPSDFMATAVPATKDSTSTTTSLCESTKAPSSGASSALYAPVVTAASINHDGKQASTAHSIAPSSQSALLSLVQVELNNTPRLTPDLSDMPVSASEGNIQQVSAYTATAESASSTSASSCVTVTAVPSLSSASTTSPCSPASTNLTPASFMPGSPASFFSCAPAAVAPAPPPTDLSTPSKAAADSSNVVSLKIIISDSQDEDATNDTALNQALSSISGDKIPTIYLSSPAKSPGMLPCPGTPKANLDEVAQAVSGLQNSEVFASPLTSKTGALVASPLTGTSQAQQSYIIQLPLSTTNPAIQGAAASYFLVTEPPATETQTRQVLLPASVSPGRPLPTSQFGGITPTCSQGYSSGSALVLPSSVKPVMLPVSVMGQNTLGNVQMVSNQLVAIPNPVSVQQPETAKPKQSTVAIKQSKTAGTEENLLSAENTSQQDAAKGSSHRRILCFDSSADVQPTPTTTQTTTPLNTNTSTSVTVQQPETDNIGPAPRTKPAILGGNKPKRRIEIIRCPANPPSEGGLVKEAEKFVTAQKQHKDPIKKNPRKQLHNANNKESQSASISIVDSSKPETSKKLEMRRRSKSVDRKHSLGDDKTKAKTADSHSSKSLCSDSMQKSETKNDKEESSREESAEKAPLKICEGRTEKKTQEVPNVTANKENENKGSTQQHSTPISSTSRDLSPPDISQSISNSQSKMTKAPSKTSSLVKQAAEMLQDIQGLNSPSTPVKRPGVGTPEPSLPRTPVTDSNQVQSTDNLRTPSRQKKGKDGEETPKRIILPNTPDVPTCSPASEAGSENSINMAAHTLMILSRAAIARSGTPLKNSLRQEGAGEKSPTSSKNSKKRKQSSPSDSQPAKKESKPSPSRKKDRERKRLVDCFPHDLDVDKFLSSLHYDE